MLPTCLLRLKHSQPSAAGAAHLVTRPSAKSGDTVWLVPWRAMLSSQRVGLFTKSTGDISTSG